MAHTVETIPILKQIPPANKFLTTRDRYGYRICSRCGGQVLEGSCINCSQKYHKDGKAYKNYSVVGYFYPGVDG